MGNNQYYEEVLRVLTIIHQSSLHALPLNGEKWYEIDDVQDLDIASTLFSRDADKFYMYHRRYGGFWRFSQLLDFCYLVNPYFPNKKMIEELKTNFETLLREYPSGMYVNSLLAAKYFSVKQDFIVVGNGAAELIKNVMEEQAGRKVGVLFPTFDEYPNRLNQQQIVAFVSQKMISLIRLTILLLSLEIRTFRCYFSSILIILLDISLKRLIFYTSSHGAQKEISK